MPDLVWLEHIEKAHFDKFVINEAVHDGELPRIESQLEEMLKETEGVTAYTVFSKSNDVIAFFGGYMVADGVAEVWSIMSVNIGKYPIAITRLAKQLITHYHIKLGIRRFQMKVLCGSDSAAAWAIVLGFKLEGEMKHVDGMTYWIFGRIV